MSAGLTNRGRVVERMPWQVVAAFVVVAAAAEVDLKTGQNKDDHCLFCKEEYIRTIKKPCVNHYLKTNI